MYRAAEQRTILKIGFVSAISAGGLLFPAKSGWSDTTDQTLRELHIALCLVGPSRLCRWELESSSQKLVVYKLIINSLKKYSFNDKNLILLCRASCSRIVGMNPGRTDFLIRTHSRNYRDRLLDLPNNRRQL